MTTDTDTRPNPFNADLARRTLAAIEADPTHWNQTTWITTTECGTAYCFAGWAVRLHHGTPPTHNTPIQATAEDALGIDGYLASPLFAPAATLAELRMMVADYAEAASMEQLERVASSWGAGDNEADYEEPDYSDWDDE